MKMKEKRRLIYLLGCIFVSNEVGYVFFWYSLYITKNTSYLSFLFNDHNDKFFQTVY